MIRLFLIQGLGKKPLVVSSDLIRFETTSSKANHQTGASMTFLGSGTNYMQEVNNGDWALLYAFTNKSDFYRVLNKINGLLYGNATSSDNNSSVPSTPNTVPTANGFNDGLKFVGRVSSVSRSANKEIDNGTRHVIYNVTANGFTDLDNTLYYNEYLTVTYQDVAAYLINVLGVSITEFQQQNPFVNGNQVVPFTIDILLGVGPQDRQNQNITIDGKQQVATANDILVIPNSLAKLLIGSNYTPQNPIGYTFADLLVSEVGVQDWGSSSVSKDWTIHAGDQSQNPATGFNYPFSLTKANRYQASPLSSQYLLSGINFNNTTPWSFLKNFENDPIEEMYTCLRVDKSGRVMPTLVFRQTVLNTDNFVSDLKNNYIDVTATSFFDVPRWKVDQSMVLREELTKSETQRFNYIHVIGQDPLGTGSTAENTLGLMSQIAPYFDDIDIQRYGLRMLPKQILPVQQLFIANGTNNAYWSGLLADQLMGGQDKITGVLSLYGVQEPICEGDNLEYDGNVYHIDRVMNTGIVDGEEGKRKFMTTLHLTNGLSLNQPNVGIAYPVLKPFAPSSETLPQNENDPGALNNENSYSAEFNLSDDSTGNVSSMGDFESDNNGNGAV